LASGSFDKTVRVYDLTSQQEILCFAEHQLNVSDLAWTSDSSELLSGAYDHTVKLWDIQKGKNVETYSTTGFVQTVQYNPAGLYYINIYLLTCLKRQQYLLCGNYQ
jgi:COMPASS component SWD3